MCNSTGSKKAVPLTVDSLRVELDVFLKGSLQETLTNLGSRIVGQLRNGRPGDPPSSDNSDEECAGVELESRKVQIARPSGFRRTLQSHDDGSLYLPLHQLDDKFHEVPGASSTNTRNTFAPHADHGATSSPMGANALSNPLGSTGLGTFRLRPRPFKSVFIPAATHKRRTHVLPEGVMRTSFAADSGALHDYSENGEKRVQLAVPVPSISRESTTLESEALLRPNRMSLLAIGNRASFSEISEVGKKSIVEGTARARVADIVQSEHFQNVFMALVVVNSMFLGLETDCQSQARRGPPSLFFLAAEVVFCVVFTFEMALRIFAHRSQFFLAAHEWTWNSFDVAVVGLQIVEQLMQLYTWMFTLPPAGIRILLVLRHIRITRLVRLIHFVKEMERMFFSIMSSMASLFWTLSLLAMLVYILSVFFAQVALDVGDDSDNRERMDYWFGGLPRTILTMFEAILGGVSWDEIVNLVILEMSPFMGVVFCAYIAFCMFALMNMATGVFVDMATQKAQEDKDTTTANRIGELFFNDPEATSDNVTLEEFEAKMDSPDMQAYFKAINVDPAEARGLFQLLDADGGGTVDAEELVNGCLRLRGQAKALELSLLTFETAAMNRRIILDNASILGSLNKIKKSLNVPTELEEIDEGNDGRSDSDDDNPGVASQGAWAPIGSLGSRGMKR